MRVQVDSGSPSLRDNPYEVFMCENDEKFFHKERSEKELVDLTEKIIDLFPKKKIDPISIHCFVSTAPMKYYGRVYIKDKCNIILIRKAVFSVILHELSHILIRDVEKKHKNHGKLFFDTYKTLLKSTKEIYNY